MEETSIAAYNYSFIKKENASVERSKIITQKLKKFPLLHVHWENSAEAPYGVHLLIGIVALIVGSAGLVGNVLVIYLFIRFKGLRRTAFLFVLNLAIGDTLLILTNVPVLVVSSFKTQWVAGVSGCRLFAFCGGLSGFVSINTLTILAVERAVVIAHHLPNTNRLSQRGVLILCCCIWIYSFLWSIPPYLGWGGHMMEGSQTSCTFDYFTRTVNNTTYVISILVFCFGLQLVIITISYVRILIEVFFHRKDVARSFNKRQDAAFCLRIASNKNRNIEWRTTKAVLSLVTVYCLSWMPYAIISVIGQFGNQSLITPLSSALPGVFAKMSSFVNPIIYTLLHSKYRQMIWPCCVKRKRKLTTSGKRSELEKISNSSTDCKNSKTLLPVENNPAKSTTV